MKKTNPKTHECKSNCGKKFTTKYYRDIHSRMCIGIRFQLDKIHSCVICNKKFSRQSSVRKHKRVSHELINKFKCELCHRQYIYRYELKNHMASHENKRSFKCDVCNQTFNTKKNLIAHHNRNHNTTKRVIIDNDNKK